MFSAFNWLRRKSAEAVIGGVADAIAALTPEGEEVPTSLEELRSRLAIAATARALPPAATDDESAPVKVAKKRT